MTDTVLPVMNGHTRDQAKVSVHCRWPLVTGTDGQAGEPNIIHLAILPTTITTSDIPNQYIIVIIMYAIVVNLNLMQHNNWGIVGLKYANVGIQRRPRWLSLFASISYVPFAFCRTGSAVSPLHDVLRPTGAVAGWTNRIMWLFRRDVVKQM